MKIIKAKPLGLCQGARNSLEHVIRLIDAGEKVSVFGELLHNPRLIENLKARGVNFPEVKQDLKVDGKLVIRAHGVSDKVKASLERQNEVVDLTCPKVIRIKNLTKLMESKGFHIVYLGKAKHPETEATLGDLKNFSLIQRADEARLLRFERAALFCQTTSNIEEFYKAEKILKSRIKAFESFNTICEESIERQKAAKALANRVDLMVVIGGKHSSNTRELFQVCKELKKTLWVESPEEVLEFNELIKKSELIGVTAGASTPDGDINQVISLIEKIGKEKLYISQ